MILQPLIERNNSTLAFLNQGDFRNAVLSSTAAMTLLQELQRNSPAFLSTTGDSSSDPDCLDQCMLLADVITSDDAYQETTTESFVYELGIAISLDKAMRSKEILDPILIFNSALAHQLYAKQHEDEDTAQSCSMRAKKLYELTLKASKGMVDQNLLFRFAALNNMAVIESQSGDVALSTQYFGYLLSVLMLLVDQNCSSRLCRLRGFLSNVSFQIKAASAA